MARVDGAGAALFVAETTTRTKGEVPTSAARPLPHGINVRLHPRAAPGPPGLLRCPAGPSHGRGAGKRPRCPDLD